MWEVLIFLGDLRMSDFEYLVNTLLLYVVLSTLFSFSMCFLRCGDHMTLLYLPYPLFSLCKEWQWQGRESQGQGLCNLPIYSSSDQTIPL